MKQFIFRERPEQKIEIPIPDTDLHINGVLRGDWSQPLVIMMHGLGGSHAQILQYLGAHYFGELGFATLRLNMYDFDEGTRDLRDCTVAVHAADFEVVVEFVRAKGVPKVFAEGHSYGGLTILRSKATLDGALLWDPSHFAFTAKWDIEYKKPIFTEERVAVDLSGYGAIHPVAMLKERKQLATEGIAWAKKPYPTCFFTGTESLIRTYVPKYATLNNAPLHLIQNAGHVFRETDASLLELFERSGQWLKKQL